MAFILQNWAQGSTSANIYGPTTHQYITTTDTMGTVSAANYFSAVGFAMNVGDQIIAVCSNGTINLQVSAVNNAVNPVTISTTIIVSGGQAVLAVATGTLTQANITGMFAAPVNLLIPPVAGNAIIVDSFAINYHFATTAFTGGGVVAVQYGSTVNGAGTLAVQNTIAATIFTSAASQVTSVGPNTTLVTPITTTSSGVTATSGIYISNQTAAFAGGNAASTAAWILRYYVLPTS